MTNSRIKSVGNVWEIIKLNERLTSENTKFVAEIDELKLEIKSLEYYAERRLSELKNAKYRADEFERLYRESEERMEKK